MIKFRCSSLSKIMTGASLTESAKKFICEIFDSWERGVRYEFSSKETEKGTLMESEALTLVKNELIRECANLKEKKELDYYKKNEINYKNDYLTGTPDVIYTRGKYKFIDDIKCSFTRASWLYSVASIRENQKVNDDYYWQLQGYMMLTGAHEAYLVYCLMDTPQHIVNGLISKSTYNLDFLEAQKVAQNIERLHEFGDFKRVFRAKVQRNDKDIEKIKKRVKMANDWVERYIYRNIPEVNIEVFAV